MSIKKNITIPKKDLEIILKYCKKMNITFSKFMRMAAKDYIKKSETLDLKEFLLKNCEFASEEEEKDILKLIHEYEKECEN